jgi:hypothetical protein
MINYKCSSKDVVFLLKSFEMSAVSQNAYSLPILYLWHESAKKCFLGIKRIHRKCDNVEFHIAKFSKLALLYMYTFFFLVRFTIYLKTKYFFLRLLIENLSPKINVNGPIYTISN